MLRHMYWTGVSILLLGSCAAWAGERPSAPASSPATVPGSLPRRTLDTLDIRVDPRVELLSIVCRLAGNPEYNRARINAYTRDVDEYFQPYRDHPAIKRLRQLRSSCGISFDAPMSLAVHLSDAHAMKLLVTLESWPEDLDQRWRQADLPAYVTQLREFAEKTHFGNFLGAHQELFDKAVAQTKATLANRGHLEWFDGFFGPATAVRYHLVLSMLNGENSYGVRLVAGHQEDAYSILGAWNTSNDGVPRFDDNMVWVLVHEFGHSYVNPIVFKHMEELRQVGMKIYALDPNRMQKQAYGHWATVMCESVLRACVIRYLQVNESAAAAQRQRDYDTQRGFTWVPGLSDLLIDYEQHRDRYPTFEAFIPRIVAFFNEYVARSEVH